MNRIKVLLVLLLIPLLSLGQAPATVVANWDGVVPIKVTASAGGTITQNAVDPAAASNHTLKFDKDGTNANANFILEFAPTRLALLPRVSLKLYGNGKDAIKVSLIAQNSAARLDTITFGVTDTTSASKVWSNLVIDFSRHIDIFKKYDKMIITPNPTRTTVTSYLFDNIQFTSLDNADSIVVAAEPFGAVDCRQPKQGQAAMYEPPFNYPIDTFTVRHPSTFSPYYRGNDTWYPATMYKRNLDALLLKNGTFVQNYGMWLSTAMANANASAVGNYPNRTNTLGAVANPRESAVLLMANSQRYQFHWDSVQINNINIKGIQNLSFAFGALGRDNSSFISKGLSVSYKVDNGAWVKVDTTGYQNWLTKINSWFYVINNLPKTIVGESISIRLVCDTPQTRYGRYYVDDLTLSGKIIKVSSIKITATDKVIKSIGGTLQLTTEVAPANAFDNSVIWSIDDVSKATISESGLVTAKADGKVKVAAKANDGSGLTATYEITIGEGGTKLQAILYLTPPTKIDATTGEYADQPVIDLLTATGYKVIPFGVTKLQNATQAQIDSLNSAALIIMGRGCTSGDFSSPSKQKWNAITAPILSINLWALRTSRANWFKTVDSDASNIDSSFNFTYKANLDKATDPVFAGLTSPVGWFTGPYSILKVKTAGNGTILASSEKDQSVLFVRFEPNVRFYADSADTPAGPRTYMGNGSDNKSDAAGNKIYNYLNFTAEGRQVFLKEVARMSGLVPTPVPAAEALVSKAATSPVLDGKIDDKAWSDANQYDIKRAFKGDIFANSADLRGYWKATFDDKGIYVMVNVTKDDVHYTDGTLGQAWEKDIIGVYFDMNPTLKDGGFPGGGTWDGHNGGHYQIELKEKTNPGSFSAWCAGCQVKITYDSTATNTSAIQELFVPWTSIPSKDNVVYKPSTTQPIGFDVYLSDNDGGKYNTPARRRLVWSNIGTVNENYNYMDDAGTMSFKIELPPAPSNEASITKASVTPVIDGIMDDKAWTAATQYNVDKPFTGDKFASTADLAGYWKATYDDNGIYVLVNVTNDDIHYTDGTLGQAWEKDITGIYFDMNSVFKDGKGTKDNVGHYQIELKEKANFGSLPTWCIGCQNKFTVDSTAKNTSIVQELFVPWTAIPSKDKIVYTPSSAQPIGFDVYLSDNDGGANTTPARRRLVWSNEGKVNEDYSNMDDAGTIKFADAGIPTVYTVLPITKVVFGKVDDAVDYKGDVSIRWDKDSVYMIYTVADEKIVNTGNAYQVDNLEIYFDIDNSKNIHYPRNGGWLQAVDVAYDANDWQLRLVPDVAFATNNTARPSITEGYKHVYKATATGYTFNLNVAWSVLMKDFAPAVGKKIGFDVLLSDNDATASDANRNQITWNSPTGNPYNDPSLFGTLELTDNGLFKIITDTEKPKAPANVVATVTESDVKLTWDPATDNIVVQQYIVYQGSTAMDPILAKKADNTVTIKALANGDYSFTVAAVDVYGNTSAKSAAANAKIAVGMDDIIPFAMSLYPNPADNAIYLTNIKSDKAIVNIYNTNGVLVLSKSLNGKKSLNVSRLTRGMYTVKVMDGTRMRVCKLIKK